MKLRWHKFKPPISMEPGRGSSPRERGNSIALSRPSSVSQEYKAALRTKSYAELWRMVQSQLTSLSTDNSLLSPASSRNLFIAHLSETLLEPDRETLAGMIESFHLHHLLVDYFKASSEACDACELLLLSVHQTRANYERIARVIGLARRACNGGYTDRQCKTISQELEAFSSLGDPLSDISPVWFHDMKGNYTVLLHRLTRKRERIRAKERLARYSPRARGFTSVVVPVHGATTGAVAAAAPRLISSCFGMSKFSKKEEKLIGQGPSSSSSNPNPNKRSSNTTSKTHCCGKRLSSQLNVAAKGLYIMINDMDTVGSLVGRLQDEVEHTREWADTAAKNSKSDKILREVVRELELNSLCFMEQLGELEEHSYLCLLAIKKSRRCLLQEIMAKCFPLRVKEKGSEENTDDRGFGK